MAAAGRLTTAEFVHENGDRVFSFLLSFVVIAGFWTAHNRLYAHLRIATRPLVWLNVAWMLTIVWLPVPTAIVGAMPTDRLQILLYVGTMLLTCLVMVATHLFVLRHQVVWEPDDPTHVENLHVSLVISTLFLVALLLSLAAPGLGYYPLLLLVLAGPLGALLRRRAGRPGRSG